MLRDFNWTRCTVGPPSRKEDHVSQEPWELLRDHDFTEEQWKGILKPVGNVTVTDKDRQAIVITEIVYRSRRFRKFSSGEFGWLDRPAQIAKCLDQVSTAATKLHIALRNASAKLDAETLPHVWAGAPGDRRKVDGASPSR